MIAKKKRNPVTKTSSAQVSFENIKFNNIIINSMLKLYEKKTKLLLDHLKTHKNRIGWDCKGTVLIEGEQIKNSNIVDLMNDAPRHRKQSTA